MTNAEFLGNAAGDSTIQRKLLADVGYFVAPIQMQKQPPFNIGQEMVNTASFAAKDAMRPPLGGDIIDLQPWQISGTAPCPRPSL
jgi:hypothetical protein